MTLSRRAACFALVCVLPAAVSAQGFEGVISMRIAAGKSTQPPQEVEYYARGGNVRVNLATPAGPVAMLGLGAEQKMFMVVESQKSYMELAAPDAKGEAAKLAEAKVTRTGKKETIAGYECEHVIIETTAASGPQRNDVCVTKALGRYVNPMASLGNAMMPAWQKQLVSDGSFPLRVTLSDGVVALEVTKVEKKRVSDALFRIPADFNKMDMPKRP
jgi:hypothetical protein